jgi:hypothetical protein
MPILYWSMTEEEILSLLKSKGYSVKSRKGTTFSELYKGETLNIDITSKMDIIFNRLVAKTAFNYLVYNEGHEYALLQKFNSIRAFIRFGTYHDCIKVNHFPGKVVNFTTKKGNHAIGLAWGDEQYKSIYGIVSWFNEITHTICLAADGENIAHPLPFSVFNNVTRRVATSRQSLVL